MQGLRSTTCPARHALLASVLLFGALGHAFAQSAKPAPPAGEAGTPPPPPASTTVKKVDDPAAQKTDTLPPLSPAEARQAQLAADTKRLYELAEELKIEVAKTNKDTLSLTVVKKAAEVEKLAKSIKQRMRYEPPARP